MKKTLHLICNAHIDPVWQWEWEEGACETISTFRVAAKFCREYDNFVFCHNEALLYMWIEEYEPSLFEEIKALVRLGKWHIMGGWYLQPDCNMPSGEGLIRNILVGRTYFFEKFGVIPTTAVNFDPFGHTRGLVQIMAKSGYDSYLFCRPNKRILPLPSEKFTWVGYDGSEIIGLRASDGYNSNRGKASERIERFVNWLKESDFSHDFCLWGVGNHGGGPSKKDLDDIQKNLEKWKEEGVQIIHSTEQRYLSELRAAECALPKYEEDLNPFAVGCYTSQVRVKQKYRKLENELFSAEKMCSALSAVTDFEYPEEKLREALDDLLTVQFHDALPGSSIASVEEMTLRTLDHGLEILSKVKAKAFFRLSVNESAAKDGEIPIIAYNPHPYPVEDDFECEFVLADQNRTGSFFHPSVYCGDAEIASQPEKEDSNIPIDWRKKVVFHAVLPPMQISRFDCRLTELSEKPRISIPHDEDYFYFDSGMMQAKINRKTGLIDSCVACGREFFKENAFSVDVYADDEDPWYMRRFGWDQRENSFHLLSQEEGTRFCALKESIPSVRLIEDGKVRTVMESLFGYSSSKAVVRYTFSKIQPTIDLQIRIFNFDKKKIYKLSVPCSQKNISAYSEVAFGEEACKTDVSENINQKYICIKNGESELFTIYNQGIYGSSLENDRLMITLMRSPSYCAHPVDDKEILPTDRYSSFIEQGERTFDLRIQFGEKEKSYGIAAQIYNEKPMVLSFFPSEMHPVQKTGAVIRIEGSDILMSAFKKAERKDCYVLRLFNTKGMPSECKLLSRIFEINEMLCFGAYEVKTYRLSKNSLTECDMMEGILSSHKMNKII